jgi:hypothetical protein
VADPGHAYMTPRHAIGGEHGLPATIAVRSIWELPAPVPGHFDAMAMPVNPSRGPSNEIAVDAIAPQSRHPEPWESVGGRLTDGADEIEIWSEG